MSKTYRDLVPRSQPKQRPEHRDRKAAQAWRDQVDDLDTVEPDLGFSLAWEFLPEEPLTEVLQEAFQVVCPICWGTEYACECHLAITDEDLLEVDG